MKKKKTTRQQIVDEARTWLGTPFHHQGRLKGVGADCAGIVDGVARAFGFSGNVPVNYGRQPDCKAMKAVLDEHMDPIPVAEATLADVLWFAFDGDPQHVGIITDLAGASISDAAPGGDTPCGRFGILHSYAQAKKCVEHGMDDVWRKRIRGAWRFRGIES